MNIDQRNYFELEQALELTRYTIYKDYLKELNYYNVVPFIDVYHEKQFKDLDSVLNLLKLTKVCYEKGEDVLQKLSTIYNSTMSENVNFIVLIDSLDDQPVDFYIGFSSLDRVLGENIELLKSGFDGNFTGTKLDDTDKSSLLIEDIMSSVEAVSCVSCSTSLRDKTKTEQKDFIQGIEKFIDSMQGKIYTAMFIAEPIDSFQHNSIKLGLETLSTTLSQFEKSTISYNESISNTYSDSFSKNYSDTVSLNSSRSKTTGSSETFGENQSDATNLSKSISTGTTETYGENESTGTNTNKTLSTGTTETFGENSSDTKGKQLGFNAGLGLNAHAFGAPPASRNNTGLLGSGIGGIIGAGVGAYFGNPKLGLTIGSTGGGMVSSLFSGGSSGGGFVNKLLSGLNCSLGVNRSTNSSHTLGTNHSLAKSENESFSTGLNQTTGTNHSLSTNQNESYTTGLTQTTGTNHSLSTNESISLQESIGNSTTTGTTDTSTLGINNNNGSSIQFEQKNKSISKLLENLDSQLKKVEKGQTYGLYKFSAYFLSSREDNAVLAANTYKALMIGDDVETEARAVNTWKDYNIVREIKEYLKKGKHPIFDAPGYHSLSFDATTMVNGYELPIHMGVPTKSIVGLPVVEHIRFGRSVTNTNNDKLHLGCVYHMGRDETQPVNLELKGLTSHTFITGTTGSGKSNTIYKILNDLNEKQVKFLIVEPAKGEYKNMFGKRDDVNVYGSNPRHTKLLRINPFRFNSDIHVLEHIDRLVDIFNVCWSMYDAMSAVLKDAIERAYVSCGWDMLTSINKVNKDLYPNFNDILDEINIVIDQSMYSQEVKGNYIGALSTRIKSLTNGITGMMFSGNDIPDETLFNENTIVDLSRIGSTETKSFIMGILVMKLSEYYLSIGKENSPLKHVTVLEEAHNILKRTSTDQSSEGSNLSGKAVEMISNAIAEMRTYGEGFIIADQSPSMLDMSAIRNTNTKIIMKLPDFSDRELVGKAASLNDDQIIELSRLETGVCAVYQNNWVEPVLCKVEEVQRNEEKYVEIDRELTRPLDLNKHILDLIKCNKLIENINNLNDKIINSNLKAESKVALFNLLNGQDSEKTILYNKFVYLFLNAEKSIKLISEQNSKHECIQIITCYYNSDLLSASEDVKENLVKILVKEYAKNNFDRNFLLEMFK